MRILVTGATGFIGSRLVENLSKIKKYRIRCLVRRKGPLKHLKNIEIFSGDITSKSSVKNAMKNVDIVVHLAAIKYHYLPDAEIYETNVMGTKNLLDYSQRVKHFIYISTILVHNPLDTYSKTKLEAEKLVEESGLKFTILRLPFIFGKGDKTNITKMLDFLKKYPIIPIIGNGKQLIYPMHVDDVVEIIKYVIKKNKTGKFVVYNHVMTVNKFIDIATKTLRLKRLRLHIPIIFIKIFSLILSLVTKKPFITTSQLSNIEKRISLKNIKRFKYKYLSLTDSIKRTMSD